MNKNDLIRKYSAAAGITQQQASVNMEKALAAISAALRDGEEVSIQGFGKLALRTAAARKGRNPRTGETIDIPERQVVRFKPFEGLLTYAHRHQ